MARRASMKSAVFSAVVALSGVASAQSQSDVREVLEDKAYSFCHDPEYPLSSAERRYCPFVGKSSSVCKKLPDACENENYPKLSYLPRGDGQGKKYTDYGEPTGDGSGDGSSGNGSGNGSGSGDRSGKPDKAQKPPKPPPEPVKIEIPGWLAAIAKVLFYLLAFAFVAVIVYLIVKNLLKGRDKDEAEDQPTDVPPDAPATPAAPRGPIETDVDRLLNLARAAAARGDFKEAIEAAYAALLRRLEGDGLIDMHPSRTNGDYVRQIRDKQDLRQAVRSIATDVERMQFGDDPPNPTLFESVYRRVLPLVGRASVVLAILLGAGSQLSCAEPAPVAGDGRSIASLGSSRTGGVAPFGTRAVAELLEKKDKKVRYDRDAELELEGRRTIVLLPDATVDDKTWKKLITWVRKQGGHLVVAGYRDELEQELDVSERASIFSGDVGPATEAPYALMNMKLGLPPFGSIEVKKWGGMRKLLERTDEKGRSYEAEVYAAYKEYESGGRIVLFADDALFKNIALAAKDNASYIVQLFAWLGHEDVELWDGYTRAGSAGAGKGAGSPLEAMKESKLGPVMLHLLALVLLYLFYRGWRFGTPRDPKAESRRAFADHARALGMTYARARASRHALGLYAAWAMERLRDRFGRANRRGVIPLAEAVAERSGRPVGQVVQILTEALGAKDEVAPPSSYRGAVAPAPHAGPPGGEPVAGPQRDFFVMRQLESFLTTTGGKPTKR
jgi:hypothetical protein